MKQEISEYDTKKITQRVHAHNEYKKIRDLIISELVPTINTINGKKMLKKDGRMLKKHRDLIENKLEEIKNKIKLVPLDKGYWIKLSGFYLSVSEYSMYVNIRLNMQTGVSSDEWRSTPNEYKEFAVYIGNFEYNEGVNTWKTPLTEKTLSVITPKPEDKISLSKQLKQFAKVKELKEKFELEKAKLSPYNLKELV